MTILSIDAWGNKKDGYEWNNWHSIGEIEKTDFEALKTDKQIAQWFFEAGYTTSSDLRQITIEDDQYNVLLLEKKTQRPLFAIEHGKEY